jgi:uncharacterized membrane protein
MTGVLIGLGPLRAWPVVGWAYLTFLGLALALWVNHRSARITEIIEINPDVVRVAHFGPATAPREERFNPAWLRVSIQSDRTVANRITLHESGRSMSIGEFLSPQERVALAEALKASLRNAGRSGAPGNGELEDHVAHRLDKEQQAEPDNELSA